MGIKEFFFLFQIYFKLKIFNKILKRAVNFFLWLLYVLLADHASVFCSSFLDLRSFQFYCLAWNAHDLTWWLDLKVQAGGRWGATWENGLGNYLGVKFLWHVMLRNDDAAFSGYSSYLLYRFLQDGKIKVTALSRVWKFWEYHCQNSDLIMTMGEERLG